MIGWRDAKQPSDLIRVSWFSTQAKIRLEWGTQPLLLVQRVGVNFLCTGNKRQAVLWLQWDTWQPDRPQLTALIIFS